MKQLNLDLRKKLEEVLHAYPLILSIVEKIHAHKGQPLLVGGAVRDLLLDLPIKDLDIEVHNLSLVQLEKILQQFGVVSLVGKSFGVLRLQGLDIDWSLPRTDSQGRKPEVIVDPNMPIKEAFERRDLTINAMGIDLITFELIDPFNGQEDLKNKLLRAPNAQRFVEDPLRFFRVMQFIGRFEMKPDQQLTTICKTMNLLGVSVERKDAEFAKLMLKSQRPSLGLRWIKDIERIKEILPELAALIGVPQERSWHPEGDVFEHSMQAVDAAATLHFEHNHEKLVIIYAALCHDLGKATTTEKINGIWRSYGHEKESARLCVPLLKRITNNETIIYTVQKLVRYHMEPGQFVNGGAKPAAYKRLARKLSPDANLHMLGLLAIADTRGRNPESHEPLAQPLPEVIEFLKMAAQAHVLQTVEKPVLQGRDLIDIVKPGPEMGKLLKKAYEIQLEENIQDKNELKQHILNYLRTRS